MRNIAKLLTFSAALVLGCGALQAQSALRSGDKVMITISGVPASEQGQVNKEYTVSEDGTINLVYLKSPIMASGRSSSELEDAIEAAYRGNEIYTSPTITCSTQQGARFVDVAGEVKAPQRVPYTEDLTFMSAMAACGGLSPYAKEKDIQLIRKGRTIRIDIRKIRKGEEADLQLQPGDKIIVDQSAW